MRDTARRLRGSRGRLRPRRAMAILLIVAISAFALAVTAVLPTPARAVSPAAATSAFSDDFTRDTALNSALWEVNGPAGTNFSSVECASCAVLSLVPSFSSAGMEIAQANGSYEVGTIQSVESFAPPLTVTAVVRGAVSNGHPFLFGITSPTATSGVQITANLNPDDCSNETNCANSATCGNPANPSIPAGQCYYGIYPRVATGSGSWPKGAKLNATPSVGPAYTVQISVDSSGGAQYNLSQGGQLLGQATAQIGTGPYYIIMAQSEGAPVPGPGPNQAYWMSVSFTPSAPSIGPSSPGPSSSGLSSIEWLIIVVVVAIALILLLVARNRRRRDLTVTVVDSGTLAPVRGAGVTADGPTNFTGSTGGDGRVAFGGAKPGDYSITASAAGYRASTPVSIPVSRTAAHTVRLAREESPAPVRTEPPAPAAAPSPPPPSPPSASARPAPPSPSLSAAPPAAAPPAPGPSEPEEMEGWGGERIRQIVRTFQSKGALSPETALTADELGLSRMFVRIMKRRRGRTKVFVEVNGRYYLDEKALREMR